MPGNGVVDGITLLGEGRGDILANALYADLEVRRWKKAKVTSVASWHENAVVALVHFFEVPTTYLGEQVDRESESVYLISDGKAELLRRSHIYDDEERDSLRFEIKNGTLNIYMYDFLVGKPVCIQFLLPDQRNGT